MPPGLRQYPSRTPRSTSRSTRSRPISAGGRAGIDQVQPDTSGAGPLRANGEDLEAGRIADVDLAEVDHDHGGISVQLGVQTRAEDRGVVAPDRPRRQ